MTLSNSEIGQGFYYSLACAFTDHSSKSQKKVIELDHFICSTYTYSSMWHERVKHREEGISVENFCLGQMTSIIWKIMKVCQHFSFNGSF